MLVYFKPTASRPTYHGTGSATGPQIVFQCTEEGEYDWPEEKVAQVCEDFPESFSVGSKKAAKGPSHNRAAPPPGKDK
jgi:hypothetical protein